jgi:flagellar biosynthesis regulator FlaF
MDTKTITDLIVKVWTAYTGFIQNLFSIDNLYAQLLGGAIIAVLIWLLLPSKKR